MQRTRVSLNGTSFFALSAEVEMMGKLHLDLCYQERLIPSDVGLKIRLIRSRDAFVLMSPTANASYRLVITECKLYVRKVKVSSSVFLAHAKALTVSNFKYPINRVVCKTFTVPQGNLDFCQENLFSGHLPTRLVVALTDNDGFNGIYAKNPFNFKHFNMTRLKLYIDGQPQNTQAMDIDFANNKHLKAYLSLFDGTGKLGKDEGLDISRAEYADGYTLFAWDLTPDISERDHMNLHKEGTVRLDATFAAALPQSINVIVYAEFESVIEINRNRQVLTDFS